MAVILCGTVTMGLAHLSLQLWSHLSAVQYLRSTSLTIWLRNVGHDGELQQTTRRVRSVVPSTHSTSPTHCSCHQPGSPPPFCSTSCHPDSHAQASEVLWSHRPLGLWWGPFTCPQRRHRRPAEGVETTSWSSSSNMAAYRRERPQITESEAVVGPAQSLWLRKVAWNHGNSDTPVGACYMMMVMSWQPKHCNSTDPNMHIQLFILFNQYVTSCDT